MTYKQEKYQYTHYKKIIQLMQSISKRPLYLTIHNPTQKKSEQYQLCQKLVNANIITKQTAQEPASPTHIIYIVRYSITSRGEQMLGQCKLLNAKIKQDWSVSQEYIKQQHYCLLMIAFPIILFTVSFICKASLYFLLFSIFLMIFIFALALVNSLHYNASINTSRQYEAQIPNVLQLFS